jgi:glutathione S-transferase
LQDKRVDFEEWGKMKQEGWAPFGQLPVLEVDGKYLAQSAAIGRWLGYTSSGGCSIIVVKGLL